LSMVVHKHNNKSFILAIPIGAIFHGMFRGSSKILLGPSITVKRTKKMSLAGVTAYFKRLLLQNGKS
jgi:hypothetical protein